MVFCLLAILIIALSFYVYIKYKYNYIFSIKVKTIKLQPPVISDVNSTIRGVKIKDKTLHDLITCEAFLRRSAYKNTSIKTDESFFNDTDMTSDYYLVIVYHKKSNIPLLSARYYFDKRLIYKYLKGDYGQPDSEKSIDLKQYQNGEVFLADRLSGNITNYIYTKHRNYIFSLFYSEVLNRNQNCHLILMARSEQQEKLLTKYLRIGFNIIGSTMHYGKKHWVVICDLNKSYSFRKKSMISYVNLLLNRFRFKL
ncbi:MAG: hypothetical protein ABI315_02780 [Bacteroidia bacterium]